MDDEAVLELLHDVATAITTRLEGLTDWGEAGTWAGQYLSDIAADEVAGELLDRAGVGWLSEETGLHHGDRPMIVVVDPLDGSTNASRGVPWFATSLCAVDSDGMVAAVVADLPHGHRFHARRGGGAFRDETPIHASDRTQLGQSVVGLSGWPAHYLGWKQYRALGAAALDLCAVASGVLDAYIDCSPSAHGSWDYLGGALICNEAGAHVGEAFDRPLITTDHHQRRTPIAGATPELLAEAIAARRAAHWPVEEDLLVG